MARFIRRACSSCGGPRIEWLCDGQAREVIGDEWVDDAFADLGPDAVDGLDVWRCLDCGDHGAFGMAHESWFDALDDRMTGATGVRPPV